MQTVHAQQTEVWYVINRDSFHVASLEMDRIVPHKPKTATKRARIDPVEEAIITELDKLPDVTPIKADDEVPAEDECVEQNGEQPPAEKEESDPGPQSSRTGPVMQSMLQRFKAYKEARLVTGPPQVASVPRLRLPPTTETTDTFASFAVLQFNMLAYCTSSYNSGRSPQYISLMDAVADFFMQSVYANFCSTKPVSSTIMKGRDAAGSVLDIVNNLYYALTNRKPSDDPENLGQYWQSKVVFIMSTLNVQLRDRMMIVHRLGYIRGLALAILEEESPDECTNSLFYKLVTCPEKTLAQYKQEKRPPRELLTFLQTAKSTEMSVFTGNLFD